MSGAALGSMQVNLAILLRNGADDFHRFCGANPKSLT